MQRKSGVPMYPAPSGYGKSANVMETSAKTYSSGTPGKGSTKSAPKGGSRSYPKGPNLAHKGGKM